MHEHIKTLATEYRGIVTKTDPEDKNKRLVCEIDGRPAAIVYNEWCKGDLAKHVRFLSFCHLSIFLLLRLHRPPRSCLNLILGWMPH